MNPLEQLQTVARLEAMGVVVKSPELREQAKQLNEFYARGGNRAMRRAAAKRDKTPSKRSGVVRTLKAGGAKVR